MKMKISVEVDKKKYIADSRENLLEQLKKDLLQVDSKLKLAGADEADALKKAIKEKKEKIKECDLKIKFVREAKTLRRKREALFKAVNDFSAE
jgi:hypothetical protein